MSDRCDGYGLRPSHDADSVTEVETVNGTKKFCAECETARADNYQRIVNQSRATRTGKKNRPGGAP